MGRHKKAVKVLSVGMTVVDTDGDLGVISAIQDDGMVMVQYFGGEVLFVHKSILTASEDVLEEEGCVG